MLSASLTRGLDIHSNAAMAMFQLCGMLLS